MYIARVHDVRDLLKLNILTAERERTTSESMSVVAFLVVHVNEKLSYENKNDRENPIHVP